jgi:hypothetical protein
MAEPTGQDPVEFIRCCLAKGQVYWTYHVNMRLRGRGITRDQVLAATGKMELVEAYPKDKYLPSYLVLCTAGERPLHVLLAVDVPGENVRVVTAYPPDPAEWMPDLKTRRTSP